MDYTVLTSGMFDSFLAGVKANVGVILPVAIGLLVIVMGIGYVPAIIDGFLHGDLKFKVISAKWTDEQWDDYMNGN